MNERIRELAKFNERIENFFQTGPVQRAAIEEFAELIIRECADLFEVEWGDEKLTGINVGYVLKKHFGLVE
jgi:hypothetical protein